LSERKINIWLNAGVIDGATAQRIRDYESDQARPLGLWSLIGLGALAIGLGIISLVAANWDDIPGMVRLSVHGLLISGLCGAIYRLEPRKGFLGLYLKDIFLFVTAVLGLTFFGHLGQVYQTSSPLWQPLLIWLLLFSPLLLLTGRGWLISLLWPASLMGTAISFLGWYFEQSEAPSSLIVAVITSLPVFALLLAVVMGKWSERAVFWRQIGQFALTILVAGVGFKLITDGLALGTGESNQFLSDIAAIQLLLWSAAALLVYFYNRAASGISIAAIVTGAAIINFVSSIAQPSAPVVNAILFMAFWAVVGWSAIHSGWRNVFQAVVAIIALRLIILNFQLAYDLFSSGIGLIIAGLITIAIAMAAYRLSRTLAPEKSSADEPNEQGSDQ
jgi:hypothetical protein